jgi:hypothetical protein
MTNLTAKELKIFNNLSHVHSPSVSLGNKIQELIDGGGVEGSPVNAVAATGILTISGVVIDGETVIINNPLITGSDVYELLADEAQSKTLPTNKAVDITDYAAKATGALTVDTQPISGDTMTIGAKVFTFVPVGTANANGEISVGANLAAAKLAIVAAINGTDSVNTPHTLVSAGAFVADDCTITALVGGTLGNAIATTETFFTVTNVFAAVTLLTGTDCTAANAVIAIVAAITALDTQGVGAADGAGNTVDMTADVAGTTGNNITTAATMANGAFTDTELGGGINGTVGLGGNTMVDATYRYVAITDNTVADANWRRIVVGETY